MRIIHLKCEPISCPITRLCEKSQSNVRTKVTGMASHSDPAAYFAMAQVAGRKFTEDGLESARTLAAQAQTFQPAKGESDATKP